MIRLALALLLIVVIGGAAKAGVPEPDGYRLDNYKAPVPDTVKGGHVIHTAALKALLDKDGAVLIDVLPAPRRPDGMLPGAPWMPEPRRDIPGSIWLPDVGRGAISEQLDRWFQRNLSIATKEDKSKAVVFYCLAQCWMSWNATKRAAVYGYTDALWYPDGTEGWAAAGLPLAVATPRTIVE